MTKKQFLGKSERSSLRGRNPVVKTTQEGAGLQTTYKREKREYRRTGARMIGALLPGLTRAAFRKKSPLFIRLIMDWENFVGATLAQQSEPCRLRPGVLTVRCCGPVAVEIQYAAPRILESINTACGLEGETRLIQLKLVQDKTIHKEQSGSPPKSHKNIRPVNVEGVEEGPLKEALARLGGQISARRAKPKRARRF